jgi:hypothetical protein
VSQQVAYKAKAFHVGVVLLVLACLPWLAWALWLGRNDPWNDPTAHHRWFIRNEITFAAGASISFISSLLLLFGRGWRRVLLTAMAMCLLLFYTATGLMGD